MSPQDTGPCLPSAHPFTPFPLRLRLFPFPIHLPTWLFALTCLTPGARVGHSRKLMNRHRARIRDWAREESDTEIGRNPKLGVESETRNPKLLESSPWFRKESETRNPKLWGRIRNQESETARIQNLVSEGIRKTVSETWFRIRGFGFEPQFRIPSFGFLLPPAPSPPAAPRRPWGRGRALLSHGP